MIEDIRKTALAHAMELSRDRCASEASDIVKDASVFEAYLIGAASVDGSVPLLAKSNSGPQSLDKSPSSSGGESNMGGCLPYVPNRISFRGKVYGLAQSNIHNTVCSLTLSYDEIREDDGGGVDSDFVNSISDAGEHIVGGAKHKNTSSQKENTSGPELPTPGHTETVVSGDSAVTEQGTHGRTDGGAA